MTTREIANTKTKAKADLQDAKVEDLDVPESKEEL
jgi:hypothetical protein